MICVIQCSHTKAFTAASRGEFTCGEDGFSTALEEAGEALKIPITDRSKLIHDIPSEDEGDGMEWEDQENVTPDKDGEKTVKRRKRAFFAEDSDTDEDSKLVSCFMRILFVIWVLAICTYISLYI